jgi:hypothetical protein
MGLAAFLSWNQSKATAQSSINITNRRHKNSTLTRLCILTTLIYHHRYSIAPLYLGGPLNRPDIPACRFEVNR